MLLTPRRLWPVSVGAGITGFVLYDLQTGLSLQAISLFILSDIAEIAVAAIGVSLALRRREELYTTHGLIKYLLVAGIVAPLVPALIGPSATGGNRVYIWKVYFLTESLALALVTPTILGWADFLSRRTPQSGRRYL
jgi:integral membrane sensor domain MASE1